MEEFKTEKQVEALFAAQGFQTQKGQFFVGFNAGEAPSFHLSAEDFLTRPGALEGRRMAAYFEEHPYAGLLAAFSDQGIACIQLDSTGALRTTTKVQKLIVVPEIPMIMINKENLSGVTIKNYSLLATKTKTVTISTCDGMEYRLMVNLSEKELPYHEAGFAAFMQEFAAYGKPRKK